MQLWNCMSPVCHVKRKWIVMLTSNINLKEIIHCTIWLIKTNKTVIPFFWTQSFYLLSYVLGVASDNLYNFVMSAVWLRVRIPVHAPIWRSELWILPGHDGKSEPLFHSLPILLHCSCSSPALFFIFKTMNIDGLIKWRFKICEYEKPQLSRCISKNNKHTVGV